MTVQQSRSYLETQSASDLEIDASGENAEYEWIAARTVDAALDADRDVSIALTCRGSAHPKALDWLIDHLLAVPGPWLDAGAGLGGPSAYLQRREGIIATLIEPADSSARGAARLHALPVIQATADQLPIWSARFSRAWALGALSATMNPESVLDELARVVRVGGRLGLYEYVSTSVSFNDLATSNSFLTVDELFKVAGRIGWSSVANLPVSELGPPSHAWIGAQAEADRKIAEQFATAPAYRQSQVRVQRLSDLLTAGRIHPHLVVLERTRNRTPMPTPSTPPLGLPTIGRTP